MDTLIQFGISFIIQFQQMGDWLIGPMKFFSFLGSEEFFLFVLPLVYWSVDAALGIRIGMILLASQGLNDIFKMALHGPRPYWADARVIGFVSETGFGIPSGHSQKPMAIFGMIAAYVGRAWVWMLAGVVILLVGLSRLYLGVHFPHDVLFGWFLGALTLWAFVKYWDPIAARLKKMTLGGQVASVFLVSLAFIIVEALVVFLSRGFVIPGDWIVNAARNGGETPNPFALEGTVSGMGTLFGLGAGVAWIAARGGWQASGPVWKRALRYVVGFAGIALFYFGLKLVFPDGDTFLPLVFRYIRYMLVGLWLSAGAPWLFTKLQLADRPNM